MGFFVDRKLDYDQNLTPVPPADHCLHDKSAHELVQVNWWTGEVTW